MKILFQQLYTELCTLKNTVTTQQIQLETQQLEITDLQNKQLPIIMTTLQKITALNWFDFLRKIKEILLGISAEKIEEAPIDGSQYARQDGEWSEVTGGGGGSQDLQDVATIGNVLTNTTIQAVDSPFTTSSQMGSTDGFISIVPSLSDRSQLQQGVVTSATSYGSAERSLKMRYDDLTFYKNSHFISICTVNDPSSETLSSNMKLILPFTKTNGTYHFAMLEDILNPVLDTYANNAAAIIGGLPIGRVYKTVTGEIRIVV